MSMSARTFVILAAGRGTRMGRTGDSLHKALVPLDGRAVLTHLIELAPPQAKIIICVGHRADQIKTYVALAHRRDNITFIDVPGWSEPSGGPGASLLAALPHVEGDLVFTSCDTLWKLDPSMWTTRTSWAGVAPLPAGTTPERWCRLLVKDGRIANVLDKRPGLPHAHVYVGLAYIMERDMSRFTDAIKRESTWSRETQVSGGFLGLIRSGRTLQPRAVHWTDVGDEAAYRRAVAQFTGYDWTKLDEATYVLPGRGIVVKHWSAHDRAVLRWSRGMDLGPAIPKLRELRDSMMSYDYVQGESAYAAAERYGPQATLELLEWRKKWLMTSTLVVDHDDAQAAALRFYCDKTVARIGRLHLHLYQQAADVVHRIDWTALCRDVQPGIFHGDLNHGNVIWAGDRFVGIDWREDFAGESWGDLRYDLAKLLAGTYVHWDNARRGDFRPWDVGPAHARIIRNDSTYTPSIEIIGALSLLNCAPLHAPPLDEILVARGCAWLEEYV